MDRPEEFRYDTGYGLVVRVHAEAWEVDVLSADGGLIPQVTVLGPRLPEPTTPERPQFVLYGYSEHLQGQAWCIPIPSQLGSTRYDRKDFVYYDEVLGFRITVKQPDHPSTDRTAELEIRNEKDGKLLQFRILENGSVIRLDTPTTRIILDDDNGGITIEADETVTVNCKNAQVNASEDVDVQAGGNVGIQAEGDVDVQAEGDASVTATGSVAVTATVDATVTATGNVTVTATGNVAVSGNRVDLNL